MNKSCVVQLSYIKTRLIISFSITRDEKPREKLLRKSKFYIPHSLTIIIYYFKQQYHQLGGDEGARTPDLRLAKAALSQLSYIPTSGKPASYNTY